MTTKYAFPSHVSVQSFVTVKLNDKHMYNIWKTQMLSLLESHDMLEYVNESNLVMKAGDERNRRDALVRGWILGSISEHAAIAVLNSLKSKQTCFTAKHVWDQVQSMHGHKDVGEEERKKRNYGIERNYGMVTKMHGHKDAEGEEERKKGSYGIDVIKKVNEDREISRKNESLYHALECGKLEEVASILENEKDRVTDIISINGNTVLHIAVAYISNSDEFLKSLLNMLPSDIPLKDVRNVDGSTPLHLAASHWNINAAKILLDRSRDLLYAKDKEDCTPLDIVLSQPRNKEMCLFLMEQQANTPFDAHEPLLNAISYKHFDLALDFLQRCNSFKSRVILMAIAQNCPADFTPNQLLIYELSRTPVLQLITRGASNMKTCKKFASLVTKAALAYPYKFFIKIYMQFQAFKDLKKRMDELNDARELLDVVCLLIKFSKEGEVAAMDFYTDAMLEAIRRDASDVVEIIVFWFPKAALIVDEDGHNIAQVAWKNRASKVYALILDGNLAKHTSLGSQKMKQDHCGNNFLHFAARLAQAKKLDHTSSPPFRMQRELQWFKLAHEITPQGFMEKNCFGETPEMVFTKEHKDLEMESGEWIKSVAYAVTVTTSLLITIMFAATVQVPGGTDKDGLPKLISQPAFSIFQVSITASAMASALSLLLFLVTLTSPRTQEAYMYRLPLLMVIGIVSLFTSTTLAILAFASALYLIFGIDYPWISGVICPIVALPIFFFFFVYSWYISAILTDFMHSAGHFFIIRAFRHLQLVGRIFI